MLSAGTAFAGQSTDYPVIEDGASICVMERITGEPIDQCVKREASAIKTLKRIWSKVDQRDKDACDSNHMPSNAATLECVEALAGKRLLEGDSH